MRGFQLDHYYLLDCPNSGVGWVPGAICELLHLTLVTNFFFFFMLQFLIQDIFDAPKIFACKQHPPHPPSGCIFAVSLSLKKNEFQTIPMSFTIL